MVEGQPAEAAFQLVTIDDRAHVLLGRPIGRQEMDIRRPLADPASLGVAGAHEEPVRPGVKARRVAKLGKVAPDGQQRLLRRILGEVDVAQDPVRHRVETVARGNGKAREGLLVTVLRPTDQLGIHVSSALAAPDQAGHSQGMGIVEGRATQSSVASPRPAVRSADLHEPDHQALIASRADARLKGHARLALGSPRPRRGGRWLDDPPPDH